MQKGAQASIQCIEMNVLFSGLTFVLKTSLYFDWSSVIFYFCDTLNFRLSLSVSHNHRNYRKQKLELFHCLRNESI